MAAMVLVFSAAGGCGYLGPENPAISYSAAEARTAMTEMAASPVQLDRPVIVLAGYRGPPSEAAGLATTLAAATSGNPEDFLPVSYPDLDDLDAMADRVIREVEARWPSPRADETIEVDAVVISLGGLVSRWATVAPAERAAFRGWVDLPASMPTRRLRIRRMFSIVSPHRGVNVLIPLIASPVLRDMDAGSPLIQELDRRWIRAEYGVVAYGVRRDSIVDPEDAAPPGRGVIWIRGSLILSHWAAIREPRFHADIARRLRGELPLIDEALAAFAAPSADRGTATAPPLEKPSNRAGP